MAFDERWKAELNSILRSREETGMFTMTCGSCGQKFTIDAKQLPPNFRTINVVDVKCSKCSKPNRFSVLLLLQNETSLRVK